MRDELYDSDREDGGTAAENERGENSYTRPGKVYRSTGKGGEESYTDPSLRNDREK